MDPIVRDAAGVLVRAMSSDVWQQVRDAMVELWRIALPEKAGAVEAELAEARAEVLSSRDAGEEGIEEDWTGVWRLRIRRLVEADPALEGELRRFLNDALAVLPPDERAHRPGWVDVGRDIEADRDGDIITLGRDGGLAGNTPPGPPLGDDDDEW